MEKEPIFDIAHLAHVELYSPKIEETVTFFKEMLGMNDVHREGKSVYMRGYEDHYHHSLIVTENEEAGVGHFALRTTSPQALERRAKEIEKTGYGIGWIDGDVGHGRAYQFTSPDGHKMEIFWDVEYYQAAENQKTDLLNRPQRWPNRGVPVRRLDHINLLAKDPRKSSDFLADVLVFKTRERIIKDDGTEFSCWPSVTILVHAIAIMEEALGAEGRLPGLCFWYGFQEYLFELSELRVEAGFEIAASPKKRGVSQASCMCIYETGGN